MTARIAFSEIPPQLIECMRRTERYLKQCGFALNLLELMRLRASQLNGCAYCIDMHYQEAIAAGETPLRLYSLQVWRDTSFYSGLERAVLEWTEAVTLLPEERLSGPLTDTMLKYFDKPALANLTLEIVQINAWNRLMKAFAIEAGHYRPGAH